MPKTVLVVTTTVPIPVTGACEQDRFTGLKLFKKMGYNVHVIAHFSAHHDLESIKKTLDELDVQYTLVPYVMRTLDLIKGVHPKSFFNPAYYDGAVLQCAQKEYLQLVAKIIQDQKPDLLWLEYTNTWPVLQLKEAKNIPSIVRSINNEAQHYTEETTPNIFTKIRYRIKVLSEKNSALLPNVILAISPKEAKWYTTLGAKNVDTLPLRGLPNCFYAKEVSNAKPLKAICMLSNFNILHNKKAFLYLATKILPLLREQLPNAYTVYVTGKKFPKNLEYLLAEDLVQTGFVPDIQELLHSMDIAVVPSVAGQGMQQKIFEPLCSSVPVITHQVCGYDFESGKNIYIAHTPQQFVDYMKNLVDTETRSQMAKAAYKRSQELFNEQALVTIITNAITTANKKHERKLI